MSFSPHSIMVVDDEAQLASLFREFLTKSGFNAVSFTDPLLAIEHYKHNHARYSIIITDMRMPTMSGIEMACNIREIDPAVRIFLVTAFDVSDLKGMPKYKKARIDEVMHKPVRLSSLTQAINKKLANVKG